MSHARAVWRPRRGVSMVAVSGLLLLAGLLLFGAVFGVALQRSSARELDADRFARIEQQAGTSFPASFGMETSVAEAAASFTPPDDTSTLEFVPVAPSPSIALAAQQPISPAPPSGVGFEPGPAGPAGAATRTPEPATPTPMPAPGPPMPAPTHISIPAVGVDTDVVEVSAEPVQIGEQTAWKWNVADYAAGHHDTSANPGDGGNVVIAGHDDYHGEVFHGLHDIQIGDTITVTTAAGEFVYVVQEVYLRLYNDAPLAEQLAIGVWLAPMPDDRLTLVTCWPYHVDTHRLIIVAKPLADVVPLGGLRP